MDRMTTSRPGLMFIASHEGIVLSRYKDSKGIWTLGVGHTAAAGYPDPRTFVGSLTLAEALGLFHQDILKYEKAVNAAVKVPLKQHEFDALVSFHYNTGAIGKASFVKKLNAGDRAGALKGIMDWRKPPEIIGRRTAERDLFSDGKYPAPFATVYPATPAGVVQWGKGERIDLRTAFVAPPKPVQPAPAPEPVNAPPPAEVPPAAVPEPRKGWLAAIIEFIASLFKRK